MDSFHTIEVRWFYRGILPDEIVSWFNTLGKPLGKPDARSDFYLQSIAADLGVKLRQGNLEVKYRQQQLEAIEWAANLAEGSSDRDRQLYQLFASSKVEYWTKWICNDRAVPSSGTGTQGWIQVDKVRSQRLYRVEFDESIESIEIDTPRSDAAAIELTQLHLLEQDWWTIACEYLGNNISIDRQFIPLVKSLLIAYPASTTTPLVCCGYPQWLSTISANFSSSTD
jgi:hypothetical protein